MAEKSTFIKIDRNITKWRWYQDANTFRVFLHLLIKANVKDNPFENIIVKRGQLVTSYPQIANSLKMGVQGVRTAISHLKLTGELTVQTTSKYSIITINNYNRYQDVTGKRTVNQQAANSQLTGDQQQYKNIKNAKERKEYISGSAPSPLIVNPEDLTQEELEAKLAALRK